MKKTKLLLAFFSLALLCLWLLTADMEAQDVNRVALVIRTSDQQMQTACVEFSEPEISGYDVLQQSGIEFTVDVQSMGAKICSIEQTGCPVDDCWCQCKGGGDCVYWSYWHQINDQWQYSQGGASMYSVSDGDVEGWSWGPGSISEAFSPPDLSFADVCTVEQVEEPTMTPSPTATAEPILFVPADTPTSAPTHGQAAAAATATMSPTATFAATIAATSTAMPTNTPLPASLATALPVATEQPQIVPVVEPTAVPAMIDQPSAIVEHQPPDPPATAESLPVPSPSPMVESAQQTAAQAGAQAGAQAVIAAAPTEIEPTPILQERVSRQVKIEAASDRDLEVVGATFQFADLGPGQISSESVRAEVNEQNNATSLFSYAVFGLIVFSLAGLLFFLQSDARRE